MISYNDSNDNDNDGII